MKKPDVDASVSILINEETAKKIFKDSPESLQKILISTFGAATFSINIIDHVKTFSDAYSLADEATRKEYDLQINPNLSEHIVARLKLILIAKVLRGEWEPDFSNSNQEKWFPWFKFSAGSGFVFSVSGYYYGRTVACVGSRLCFPTQELSDYFGKQFIELHRKHLT